MVGDASLNHTKSTLEVADTDRCNHGKQGLNGENSKLVIEPRSEVEEGEILASICSDKTKEMLVIEEVFDFVVEGGQAEEEVGAVECKNRYHILFEGEEAMKFDANKDYDSEPGTRVHDNQVVLDNGVRGHGG